MSNIKCPYSQHIIDECAGIQVPNDRYYAWHEGYEAHKLEVLDLVTSLRLLQDSLKTHISITKEMQKEYREANHGNGRKTRV